MYFNLKLVKNIFFQSIFKNSWDKELNQDNKTDNNSRS